MTDQTKIISVNGENVNKYGFFCYKSKPKSFGYQQKLAWLNERFDEGMQIKVLYENERAVGFIEYIPGEVAWRVVEAQDYFVIHCIWVVGRGKGKGYGSRLVEECLRDARMKGKRGVVMVSSRGSWLANEKLFVRTGFEVVGTAPPTFSLLVKKFGDYPDPSFPDDWDERRRRFGPGVTIVYTEQCPYLPDAVKKALKKFETRGIKAKAIRLGSSAEVKAKSPSAYGVYGIVYNGELVSYHYLGTKELRLFDEELQVRS